MNTPRPVINQKLMKGTQRARKRHLTAWLSLVESAKKRPEERLSLIAEWVEFADFVEAIREQIEGTVSDN